MIALAFSEARLTPDEVVKQREAVKQMDQLMSRLAGGTKYHTLSLADRKQLAKEGFAADLVDNLVYFTQRIGTGNAQTHKDELVNGFTYAAFDPSLYGCDSVVSQLQRLNQGCCFYCETFLAATECGVISHFRPIVNLDRQCDGVVDSRRSPYFALAYRQDNLVYSCKACSELHKAGFFPLQGERYPTIEIKQETPLLINPYVDDPRQFIRFNPLNGQAYAFDLVQAFYQASEGLTAAEVEQRLWQNPANIPLQSNNLGQRLSDLQVDQTFSAWQASQGNRQSGRGAVTIEVLALNRPALTLSRRGVLNQLALGFSALDDKTATVDKLATHQFRSLAIDAFNSWRLQQQQPKSKAKAVQPVAAAKSDGQRLAPIVNHEQQAFPEWLRSCLIYFVPEQELTQADKRRLVCLSAKDRLYGGNQPQKSVYLAVDWKHDQHNVINVRSNRNVWQTSFAELSRSRPLELTNLFANNEVWVEGKYPPLAS